MSNLWFLLALMTVAAAFAVLWPLGRRVAAREEAADVAVYRDQLAELDRDRAAGLIGPPEAEAARTEVGRRLIAAADAANSAGAGARGPWARRLFALVALVALPLFAVVVYGGLGAPRLPGAPLAERARQPLEARSVEALVAQIEEHLAANPDDGRGWEVIAPVYMRLGRFDDAVTARRNALRILGATAAREADLGEALTFAASGVVTAEALGAFERALALDAKNIKARYFSGVAAEQDGRPADAARIWQALLAEAPADAPWRVSVEQAIARVTGAGPTEDDIAAAEKLSPEERQAMVRGMVARLAERLKEDGSDVEGWLKLIRAYVVLGEAESAKAAAADARRALAGDEEKLRRINALAKSLGLEA